MRNNNSSVTKIAISAAVISAIAAVISAYTAFLSWKYNRELSKPAISLLDVKVSQERVDKDKLHIKFLFVFKNVGKETLKINELLVGHFDFERKIFKQIDKKIILNPIHAESVFNYPITYPIDIDPQIQNEEISRFLSTIHGKYAIIFKMKYKGTTHFSKEEISEKYFVGHQGLGEVYQLESEEYKEIEQKLPEEFKAE